MEFVCIVWILEKTVNFALHTIKSLVFGECFLRGTHRVLI